MPGDYLPDDLKTLWQELSTHPLRMSYEELNGEAARLRAGLRRRSIIGFAAALIVIVAFAASFFAFPNRLQRLGSVLTVLGTAYLLVQL
jgi:hypothetical protein